MVKLWLTYLVSNYYFQVKICLSNGYDSISTCEYKSTIPAFCRAALYQSVIFAMIIIIIIIIIIICSWSYRIHLVLCFPHRLTGRRADIFWKISKYVGRTSCISLYCRFGQAANTRRGATLAENSQNIGDQVGFPLTGLPSATRSSIRDVNRAGTELLTNQIGSDQGDGFCNLVQFRADVALP
jgi:hypothetical protein